MTEGQTAEPNDEALLVRASQGDQQAIETLLIRYKNLVRRKASAMFMAGADAEDVIQEGMIGLFKAIRDFKPEFKVPFAAFASYCIMAQITDAVRQASRKKHQPLNASLSLQELIQIDGDNASERIDLLTESNRSNPEEVLLDQENLADLRLFIQSELSDLERQAVLLFMQNLSYQQIADCLGSSPKKVDNALGRARRKFIHFRQKTP